MWSLWEELGNHLWLLTTVLVTVVGSYYLYNPEDFFESEHGSSYGGSQSEREVIDLTYDTSDSGYSTSDSEEFYVKEEFLGELPKENQVDIFEDNYVDDEGNNRTKYTFVSNE